MKLEKGGIYILREGELVEVIERSEKNKKDKFVIIKVLNDNNTGLHSGEYSLDTCYPKGVETGVKKKIK